MCKSLIDKVSFTKKASRRIGKNEYRQILEDLPVKKSRKMRQFLK